MTDRLIQLFADMLETDPTQLSEESSPDTVQSWDSLAAMKLVAAIEDEFDIRLTTKEIMNMSTIGLARKALINKGVSI